MWFCIYCYSFQWRELCPSGLVLLPDWFKVDRPLGKHVMSHISEKQSEFFDENIMKMGWVFDNASRPLKNIKLQPHR